MNRKSLGGWISIVSLMVLAILLSSLSSCARPTQLLSIAITPSTGGTFGAVDNQLFFQFKAIGTYIHPPKTVDITNQVDWQSDNPQVISITSAGVASPNLDCGVAQVFAEMHQDGNDIVSNQDSITVNGPAADGCTPAGPQPTLTVTFGTGSNTGTVSSAPPGIDCTEPSSCSFSFTTGTTVTLMAAPTGTSTTTIWNSGCNTTDGNQCTVLLENAVTVTVTFQ